MALERVERRIGKVSARAARSRGLAQEELHERSDLFSAIAQGDIKLIDFGVAKASDQLHLTRTRTVLGKFSYMAPEQLRSEPIDRRADVWSLGVVAWELMTGRRLFRRSTEAATLEAVLKQTIDPPSAGATEPRLRSLDSVILRALEREPDRRFDTVHALVEGIEATGLASMRREQRGAFMKARFSREHAEMLGYAEAAKTLRSAVARPVGPQSSVTAQLAAGRRTVRPAREPWALVALQYCGRGGHRRRLRGPHRRGYRRSMDATAVDPRPLPSRRALAVGGSVGGVLVFADPSIGPPVGSAAGCERDDARCSVGALVTSRLCRGGADEAWVVEATTRGPTATQAGPSERAGRPRSRDPSPKGDST